MPRPITKADIKRWRGCFSFKVHVDDRLGLYIETGVFWSYSAGIGDGAPVWVEKKTIERRKKLGHPATKRKARQRMPEGNFSLEEMELASSIMEELSDG